MTTSLPQQIQTLTEQLGSAGADELAAIDATGVIARLQLAAANATETAQKYAVTQIVPGVHVIQYEGTFSPFTNDTINTLTFATADDEVLFTLSDGAVNFEEPHSETFFRSFLRFPEGAPLDANTLNASPARRAGA